MIRVEGVRKTFGTKVALDSLSFAAQDGMVTGLLGANGAGKTTALRIVSGLLRPDSGAAVVDGVNAGEDREGAQRRLGVIPDEAGLYGRLTTREQVRYFGNLRGLRGPELERRIDRLLESLGLAALADRRVAGFSHGERKKVALARALVHGPRNIILDEPTNGLDVMSTRAMRGLIRGLRQDGCCVVFSSHIMQEVSALCDRIVVIAQGEVVADGTPDDLRALTGQADLEDAFVALSSLEAEEVE